MEHPTASSSTQRPSRQIILLEDLPNVLHPGTADAFHSALKDYIASPSSVPIVLVISDAGTRGEDPDNDAAGGRGLGQWRKQVIDVRSVIPHTILNSPYFREIQYDSYSNHCLVNFLMRLAYRYNPIAPTIMLKALTTLLTKDSLASRFKSNKPTKDTLEIIVESSRGDIRSAIMALQFACITNLPKGSQSGNMRGMYVF